VHAKHVAYHQAPYHGDDPVRAITHLTQQYEVTNVMVDESREYNLTYVDDRDTVIQVDDRDKIINVDDRDTTSIQADGDVNIDHSFNRDNDVNMIDHSFNQDNDGVDNKGGTIDRSVATGDGIDDSFKSDNDTTVTDSHKVDNSVSDVNQSSDHTTATHVQHSYNPDNDSIDVTASEAHTDSPIGTDDVDHGADDSLHNGAELVG
jgi:hypothetical protein